MKTKSRIIALASACLGIPAMLVAHPADTDLSGKWNVTVSGPKLPYQISAVSICSKDGRVLHVGNQEALNIPGIKSGAKLVDARGHWTRKGTGAFHVTFDALMVDKGGAAIGHQHVEGDVILSLSGDKLTGKAKAQFSDPNQRALFDADVQVHGDKVLTGGSLTSIL